MGMSGVRMGPRVSLSVLTCVTMGSVWAQTRVNVNRALEERTAQNVSGDISLVLKCPDLYVSHLSL